jgi:aminoglycoside phosphotransferase (APT) family kinase protein
MAIPTRPESDRYLDAPTALRAVREQVPHLDAREASLLGSGWGLDVYLIDRRYVARFPRNAEAATYVDRDQAILEFIASEFRDFFAVPRVLHRAAAGAHFPYDFLICAFVDGVSADDPRAPVSEALTADLGMALARVHSVPVATARRAGLSAPDWDDYTGTPSFIHLDFRGNNLLVDPESGRLTGVIDWGNAAIGDPALDFMWLVVWRGWSFMEAVLSNYSLPVDDDFIQRVKHKAEFQQALSNKGLELTR